MLWRQQLVETEQEKMAPGTDHSGTDGGWDKDSSPVATSSSHRAFSIALADQWPALQGRVPPSAALQAALVRLAEERE